MNIEPSADLRRHATAMLLFARGLSIGAFLCVVGIIWIFGSAFSFVIAAIAAIMVLVSPLAPFIGFLFLWTGYEVGSCPNCFAVHMNKLETEFWKCDSCGTESTIIKPIYYGEHQWSTLYKHDEPNQHYCSSACRG